MKKAKKTKTKKITASEFDRKFDAGEDISDYLDFSSMRRIRAPFKRVNLDLPAWTLRSVDEAATRRGITRQSLIKVWIDNCLKQEHAETRRP